MNKSIPINEVVESVSVTHKFNKPSLIFLNTSDIEDGKIINANYIPVHKLKGQAKKTIKNNDILFSEIRPKNKRFAYIDFEDTEDYVVSTKLMVLRNINPEVDNKYFYYFLTSNEMLSILQNRAENRIGSFPQITFELLSDYKIRVPGLHEQKNIATSLSMIDSKIESNNHANKELEGLLMLLFDYWFIQFDFPDKNGKPYRSNGGKMIWNNEIKKEIPEDWEVFRLIDLIEKSKNGDWGIDKSKDQHVKTFCIRGADINGLNGMSSFDPPIRFIDSTHTNRMLRSDDLIIEISGGSPVQSTGRMAHISQNVLMRLENRAVCSNFCKAITLKRNVLSYIVVQYWSHLYDSGVFFNFEGKTSGIKNLLFDQLIKDVKIALPKNDELIDKYYNFADKLDTQKQNNLFQNNTLKKLRDWLLPLLMNGQVIVNN